MNAPAILQRRRDYAGPAMFAYGFRSFFFIAGLWAALAILLWLPQYFGQITLPTAFSPLDWHIHEMLYGYVAASIAGFLLTAIPNWTGRLPVNGWALAGLAFLWLAGRVAILLSAKIGGIAAAVVDVSFLAMLGCVAAREIIAAKNWRNLRVLGVISVLIVGNVVFHVEVLLAGTASYGIRIAVAAVIGLIMLVGGRIVPSFTHNWLTRSNPGRLPVPFSHFDMIAVAASALALLLWVAAPAHVITGILMLAGGILQAMRLIRWAGYRAVADRLVFVLHVAYIFLPIGFLLLGASALLPYIPATAGMHAWTAGAIGLMTLAVMTRATLGHTGQPLQAGWVTQGIYAFVFTAAVLRIIAAFNGSVQLLEFAGTLWSVGFACFLLFYGPLLLTRSPTWAKPSC